jgi:hypothetical protein
MGGTRTQPDSRVNPMICVTILVVLERVALPLSAMLNPSN